MTCPTCGEEFEATSPRTFCGPGCWPSRQAPPTNRAALRAEILAMADAGSFIAALGLRRIDAGTEHEAATERRIEEMLADGGWIPRKRADTAEIEEERTR